MTVERAWDHDNPEPHRSKFYEVDLDNQLLIWRAKG